MSQTKSCFDMNCVCLPFPYPMIATNGDTIWPFNQKGFIVIYGRINLEEKCVQITDRTAIISLQSMGYFGFKSNLNFNKNLQKDRKNKSSLSCKQSVHSLNNSIDLNKQIKSGSSHKNSNGKYVLVSTSVPNALIETKPNSDSIETKEMTKSDETFDKTLKLSFEESFFISYVFGSLNVLNTETNDYMDLKEMWNYFSLHFSEDRLKFAVNYSAYHYFRSKGWVVRNGFSFGSDFLLYIEGPPFYHALYSVLIQHSFDGKTSPQIDWFYLSALNRLSQNVRKVSIIQIKSITFNHLFVFYFQELIICKVNVPKSIDNSFLSHPNCIQSFEINVRFIFT